MLKIQKVYDRMSPKLLENARKIRQTLPKETLQEWIKNTPRDTGNARRKTKLSGNQIQANYQYAVPLDQGKSKQAPRGMDKPTWEWFQRRVRKILGA